MIWQKWAYRPRMKAWKKEDDISKVCTKDASKSLSGESDIFNTNTALLDSNCSRYTYRRSDKSKTKRVFQTPGIRKAEYNVGNCAARSNMEDCGSMDFRPAIREFLKIWIQWFTASFRRTGDAYFFMVIIEVPKGSIWRFVNFVDISNLDSKPFAKFF